MSTRFINVSGGEHSRTTNLPTVTALTVMLDIKLKQWLTGGRAFFGLGLDTNNYLTLTHGGPTVNTFSFNYNIGGSSTSVSLTAPLAFDQWTTMAFTRNAGPSMIYLCPRNGNTPARINTTTVGGADFSPDLLRIGKHTEFSTTEVDCEIANVRIWTAELSLAQIDAERRSPNNVVNSTNLHAWYPLIGNSTLDYGPNGYNLTAGTAFGGTNLVKKPRSRNIGKAIAAGSRVTKNTRAFPLGMEIGMGFNHNV